MSMIVCVLFFFFQPKTAYEWCISAWSSDVCASDLPFVETEAFIDRSDLRLDGAVVGQKDPLGAGFDNGRRDAAAGDEIGRASGRERVCTYVLVSEVAVSLKKKSTISYT